MTTNEDLQAEVARLQSLLRKRPASEKPADGKVVLALAKGRTLSGWRFLLVEWDAEYDGGQFVTEESGVANIDGWWPIEHLDQTLPGEGVA